MTAPVPPEAVEACMRAINCVVGENVHSGDLICVTHDWVLVTDGRSTQCPEAREVAAAVVAALDLPRLEREAAAKALEEAAADEGLDFCACGHSLDEHNGLGCYARLSYTPLTVCDCTDTDDHCHVALAAANLRARASALREGGQP